MTEEDKFDQEGPSTTLRPKSRSAMKGSDQLESVLIQVERELLSIGWETKLPDRKEKDQEIRRLLQRLEESEIVIVLTEETNSFRSMKKEKYKTMGKKHLKQSAKEIERVRVTGIFEDAKVLVDAIEFQK